MLAQDVIKVPYDEFFRAKPFKVLLLPNILEDIEGALLGVHLLTKRDNRRVGKKALLHHYTLFFYKRRDMKGALEILMNRLGAQVYTL